MQVLRAARSILTAEPRSAHPVVGTSVNKTFCGTQYSRSFSLQGGVFIRFWGVYWTGCLRTADSLSAAPAAAGVLSTATPHSNPPACAVWMFHQQDSEVMPHTGSSPHLWMGIKACLA